MSLHTDKDVSLSRSTTATFGESRSSQQPIERLRSREESLPHRVPYDTSLASLTQRRPASQVLLDSPTARFPPTQKTFPNGLTSTSTSRQSSNVIIPRPSSQSDSFARTTNMEKTTGDRKRSVSLVAARTLTDSNVINGKVRTKMQLIKAGTIWRNADIPIIDHPSAFFVCNQDPRVAEQFNFLAVEMKCEKGHRAFQRSLPFFFSFSAYYNKPANTSTPLQNPAIGDFCVARFSEDQHWYRARVVLIHSST